MAAYANTILILFLLAAAASAEPTQDRAALLDFINRVPHSRRISWNASSSACVWVGVTCDAGRTAVEELRLPGSGLVGPIPPNTLSRLSGLRVLSLRSNALSGGIPSDLSNLTLLRSLYLQNNLISGGLPPSLSKMSRLSRIDLSRNNLSGEIPFSLSNLTRLTRLYLEHNSFSGEIPSLSLPGLAEFNVSNNKLNGSVPAALNRFPASSFAGNLELCGGPLPPCAPFFPSPAPAPGVPLTPPAPETGKKKKKLSTAAIIAIAAVAGALLLFLLLLLLICFVIRRRRRAGDRRKPPVPPKRADAIAAGRSGEVGMTSSSMSKEDAAGAAGGGDGERNRLVFVGKGGGYSFDLEDLLRASAEVLGKGSVGTSYKAVLEEGTTVVVKRLKDVAATRREFHQHMDSLGHIDHPNLLPLRAYYYSKDEKLLVFDFLPAGSLSALLHGSRGSGRTPLDWDSRMRVAVAAARGLAHLHDTARVVHGNIKASNVLLHQDSESAALSDYGLAPVFGPAAAVPPSSRVAGYRAPEVVETRRPTFKSDVYSLGVLLLELLTGKAPNQATLAAGEEGIDLPRWVQSVVREEWTAEVFDVELMRYPNIEEEMVQLLQVAMACVAAVPDARPDARDAVRMMEDIVRRGGSPAAASAAEEGRAGSSPSTTKGGSPGPTTGPGPGPAATP